MQVATQSSEKRDDNKCLLLNIFFPLKSGALSQLKKKKKHKTLKLKLKSLKEALHGVHRKHKKIGGIFRLTFIFKA